MLIWVFLLFFFLLFLFLLFFALRGLKWYTSHVDHLNLSQNLIWVSKKYYTKWECDRVNSDLCDLELRDNIVVYMDFPTLVSVMWAFCGGLMFQF